MSNEQQQYESGDSAAGSEIQLRDLINRGCSSFKISKYEESQKLFEEALTLEPSSAEAHAWLAAVYGRRIEAAWSVTEKIKLLSKLENEITAALEIDPSLPLARRMNGARLLNAPEMFGGNPSAAIDEFRYCINQGLDEAEVWMSLAECYLKTDEPANAMEALKEALEREPQNAKAANLLQQALDESSKDLE